MNAHDLVQWWNLIFDLPFILALLQNGLSVLGVLHLSHIHFGHHDVQFGHGGHIDHHVHVGHGHDHAAHHAHSEGSTSGSALRIVSGFFSLMGLGKAPFMVVISSFCLIWGFTGLAANQFFQIAFPPSFFIWISMAIAFAAAFVFTGLMARLIGRMMPQTETFGMSESEFAGRTGKSITKIDSNGGKICVADKHLNRIELKCRTEGDEVIPYGASVIPLFFEEDEQRYIVCREEDFPVRIKLLVNSQKYLEEKTGE